jgi:hypothetical protein
VSYIVKNAYVMPEIDLEEDLKAALEALSPLYQTQPSRYCLRTLLIDRENIPLIVRPIRVPILEGLGVPLHEADWLDTFKRRATENEEAIT